MPIKFTYRQFIENLLKILREHVQSHVLINYSDDSQVNDM